MQLMTNANIEALQQVLEIVRLLPDGLYSQPSPLTAFGTGRHIRHIVDHYRALQRGVESGCVDYNWRQRDSRMETDRNAAAQAVAEIIAWLQRPELTDRLLEIRMEASFYEQQDILLDSSLRRELGYLVNHTTHHIAYAGLIARSLGVAVPEHVGVAPSTASYLRSREAVASV